MTVSAEDSMGHMTGLLSNMDTRSLPTDSTILRVANVAVESGMQTSLCG